MDSYKVGECDTCGSKKLVQKFGDPCLNVRYEMPCGETVQNPNLHMIFFCDYCKKTGLQPEVIVCFGTVWS